MYIPEAIAAPFKGDERTIINHFFILNLDQLMCHIHQWNLQHLVNDNTIYPPPPPTWLPWRSIPKFTQVVLT